MALKRFVRDCRGITAAVVRRSRSLLRRELQTLRLMALAGHMSRQMLEHYLHVRMAAKRAVLARKRSDDAPRTTVEQSAHGTPTAVQ